MLITNRRSADGALPMLNSADRFAALYAFTYMLVKMLLAILLATFVAFLRVLVAIVFLITADDALQGVVGPNRAFARRTGNMLLFTATDFPASLAGPGVFLADRLSTRAAAQGMLLTDRF